MFTGLVETTGRLEAREARGPGQCLTIATRLEALVLGESIAVSGACLTVAELTASGFRCDLSAETLAKTTLGGAALGAELNLERSLRLGDRLGGHYVLGHVDGIATVQSVTPVGEARRVILRPPSELAAAIAAKGSVTLDGVSLTVNAVAGEVFEVMLIPHTLALTTLKQLAPGARLNLEIDVLARYVARWLEATQPVRAAAEGEEPSLLSTLERAGYLG
jgi:riboflavin synthase